MNVLFYSTYHFNTETFGPYLEQIQEHLNNGDTVYFLGCDGELSSCQTNPHHSNLVCKTCISTRINAFNCLSGPVNKLTISSVLPFDQLNAQIDHMDTSSIENFKNCQFESFDVGMAVMSSIVSIFRDPAPDLVQHSELVNKQWISSMWVYEAVKKSILEYNVDRVYVFNARFATLRACLRAAHHLEKDCFVLEESNDRNHYAVYENAMPHSISYVEQQIENYWTIGGEDKEEIAMNYYRNRSLGKDSRFGHFTSHQDKGKLPEGWDENKKNIALFISSEDEFVSIGKEWENELYKNQVDGIVKISAAFSEKKDVVFYVRVHPNLTGVINDLYAITNKNVVIVPADSPVSTYNLMFHADKIITFGSSVGIEAAAFGKISILAGKTFYMNLGSTYNPKNHQELIALLEADDLPSKPIDGALKYAYYLIHFGKQYAYFKRKDTFQAFINGRIYGPSWVYLFIRKVGRFLRKRKENQLKLKNLEHLAELYKERK
jgi:hypothetical protein